ncbi:hypothetical protein [Pseudomonas sp. RIT357]|uniref:hypothetical protein n=1 Tax=Pseudomonas sp. RIT357 TaxID=1470593 RepID=UPI00044F74E5|nr:hypothetical protein [Pseudomonas sp. RIT357]EZP64198.1 hypothetical protein BW43_04138 [Pseudomonas sp. RIT357]
MLDWWDKYRDRALLCGSVIAFGLLMLVKLKLDVPDYMRGSDWKTWVEFFQSKAFEDIVGDMLTGLVAAYIFYVFIDWMPRLNAERRARKLLNSLVAGHVESFQCAEISGHAKSLAEFKALRIEDLEHNIITLRGETEVASLLAIAYMSKWSHQMMSDSLQVSLVLGIPQAQIWMELTSRIAKIKYLSEKAEKSGVLDRLRSNVDAVGAYVIGDISFVDDREWNDEMKSQSSKFFEGARKWIEINK